MNKCRIEAGSVPGIETPSGKDVAYENFPVGSWLLSSELRPHVAMFYRFARTIDDIADNPNLSAAVKLERLEGFEAAILGRKMNTPEYSIGSEMRRSLLTTRVTLQHTLDLIDAFKQDAVKSRYANWSELMAYCDRSAAPVGRYLLDLHGESKVGYGPSDALCNVLQVINHLQDCQEDYRQINRVYLPRDWLGEVGARIEDLDAFKTSPKLRYVFDRCLDGLGPLMLEAQKLPLILKNRRLVMEVSAIVSIAERLISVIRYRDPLSSRLQLNKLDYIWQSLRGITVVLLGVGRP
ncbi:MAG: squalene synthase HpnC [Magnetovibrio sp.]|nr:squalene synthase HpnC [Magnetovibrio sp.]|tara:strand:+ start:959 stop:1840 length:882 start_codon:yes stop_codon:yes gene_type:complete